MTLRRTPGFLLAAIVGTSLLSACAATTQTSTPTPPGPLTTTPSQQSPFTQVPIPTNSPQDTQSNHLFDLDEYDIECMDRSLGLDVSDEIVHKGRQPTATELRQIAHCHTGLGRGQQQDSRDAREAPTPLPPGVVEATLRSVSLPSASHLAPANAQCETFENDKCAELRWERIDGLLTGAVTTLHVAPTSPNVVYAGIDSNGMSLWKSEDSGNKWTRVHSEAHASDVAINPSNPSVVLYSELEEGVYVSTDGGTSWKKAIGRDQPDWVRTSGLYFKALAFSADSPDVAYAVASRERGPSFGDAEVYHSDSAGLTWSHSGTCVGCGSVYTVVIQPGDPKTLWVAGDFGVHVSRDSGSTWSRSLLTSLSQDAAAAIGLAIHPSAPATILAATSDSGVYRSSDGGQTWNVSNTGLESVRTHQVAFAPSDSKVAYLTTHKGVYQSNDAGETWTRRDSGWTYAFTNALAIDPKNANVAYVGTAVELHTAHTNHINQGIHEGGGLYKTVDGGTSWQRIDQEMEESSVVSMATHPYLPFNLWVGDKAGRGAFVTPDAGDTWLHGAWRAAHYPMVFAFSQTFPSTHYLSSAVAFAELTASTDGGNSWATLSGGLGKAVDLSSRASRLPSETGDYFHVHLHGLAVAPSDPDILYTGTIYDPSITEEYSMMGAVIFTSRDGGRTWAESSNGFPIETPTSLNAFVVHPTDPNTAYAMTSGYESNTAIGVYKTVDGGANWRPANDGLDLNTRDLQIDPLSPMTLYAATASGVYKTVDGAESWNPASDGLPTPNLESAQRRLLTSFQGGDSRGIFDLALDPLNPLQIYAATSEGVYKTKDGGSHWYPVILGLPRLEGSPFWHDRVLEIDATGQVVYAALATEENGERGDTQIYRAVMEPLLSVRYEYEVNGELLQFESNSHVYDVVYDQNGQELRFNVAGPRDTRGEMALTFPLSLLSTPLIVRVDGQVVPASAIGQIVSFEYTHVGRSEIIVKRG